MTDQIDVSCFGEVLFDAFEADPKTASFPTSRAFRMEQGGAAANLATGLARLGLASSLVSAVGADKFGEALLGMLEADGVGTKHVQKLKARTGVAFVFRNDKGDPSFLFYREGTADMRVTSDHVSAASAKASFGVVGTSTLIGAELKKATYKFIELVKKAKGTVVVDLNVRAHLWADEAEMKTAIAEIVAKADVVKASDGDLEALAGKRGISWLESHAKHATWLLTRGENGAAAVGKHGEVTAPTKRVRCIDAVGAGDAFLAGALAVLVSADASPKSALWSDAKLWSRALEAGHLMGAKAVSAVGAVGGLLALDDVKSKMVAAKKG
jgi:fructokinase